MRVLAFIRFELQAPRDFWIAAREFGACLPKVVQFPFVIGKKLVADRHYSFTL